VENNIVRLGFLRLLLSWLDQHLDRKARWSTNQYGFRSGRSTEDAIVRLLEKADGVALGAAQHQYLCVAVLCKQFQKNEINRNISEIINKIKIIITLENFFQSDYA